MTYNSLPGADAPPEQYSRADVERGFQLLESRGIVLKCGDFTERDHQFVLYEPNPAFIRQYGDAVQFERATPNGRDLQSIGIDALVVSILSKGPASADDTELMASCFLAVMRR